MVTHSCGSRGFLRLRLGLGVWVTMVYILFETGGLHQKSPTPMPHMLLARLTGKNI